jgi:hypothetical protein
MLRRYRKSQERFWLAGNHQRYGISDGCQACLAVSQEGDAQPCVEGHEDLTLRDMAEPKAPLGGQAPDAPLTASALQQATDLQGLLHPPDRSRRDGETALSALTRCLECTEIELELLGHDLIDLLVGERPITSPDIGSLDGG